MTTLQLNRAVQRRQIVHELRVVMHTHLRQFPSNADGALTMRLCTVTCNCGCWIRSYWNVTTAEALNQIAAEAEEHLLDDESIDA